MTDSTDAPLGAVDAVAVGARGLLELVALGSVSYWGTTLGGDGVRALVPFAVPLALVVVWSGFVSPKAPWRLPDPWRLGVELAVFAAASAALVAIRRPALGGALLALALVSEAVLVVRDLR